MKIRRYYGHDCDSEMGFNNGYYLDDEHIEVKDTEEAFRACRQGLKQQLGAEYTGFEEMDNGYEFITGYYDNDGNEITEDDFNSINENDESGSWRYVYVSYEEVS